MGRAIAERFAKNGDFVYIVGRRKEVLDTVVKENPDYKITAVPADVTDPTSIHALVKMIQKDHKEVDVLINNAGGSGHIQEGLKLDEALQKWNEVIATNLTSAFLMVYAFKPMLARPGGRVINISSLSAFAGSSRVGGEGYSAAKAGLHGMSRTLVRVLAPEGITVNCIAPGLIDETEFFGDTLTPERKAGILKTTPAGTLGVPADIVEGAFYLASEGASFVNGDILNINGGAQFSR